MKSKNIIQLLPAEKKTKNNFFHFILGYLKKI